MTIIPVPSPGWYVIEGWYSADEDEVVCRRLPVLAIDVDESGDPEDTTGAPLVVDVDQDIWPAINAKPAGPWMYRTRAMFHAEFCPSGDDDLVWVSDRAKHMWRRQTHQRSLAS